MPLIETTEENSNMKVRIHSCGVEGAETPMSASLPKETYIVTGVTIYFQLCGQSP